MICAELHIPLPPSLNNIFFNRAKGRAKTEAYKNWRSAAAWEIRSQKPPVFDGDVQADLTIERPNAASDLDNRLKPVFDALQFAGVIKNDRSVIDIRARWGDVLGCKIILCSIEREAA